MTTSTVTQQQNGFRYTLPDTSTQIKTFETRTPTGLFYDLKNSATVFVGGDPFYAITDFWLQNVRLYLNYFPNSVDEMINLAIANTGNIFPASGRHLIYLSCFKGTLYIAHFSSLPNVNNNQTVVVNYIQEASQGTLTAYKGNEIIII